MITKYITGEDIEETEVDSRWVSEIEEILPEDGELVDIFSKAIVNMDNLLF